jgi:hypothetical protein
VFGITLFPYGGGGGSAGGREEAPEKKLKKVLDEVSLSMYDAKSVAGTRKFRAAENLVFEN